LGKENAWEAGGVRERVWQNYKFNLHMIEEMLLRRICKMSIKVDQNCELIVYKSWTKDVHTKRLVKLRPRKDLFCKMLKSVSESERLFVVEENFEFFFWNEKWFFPERLKHESERW